MLKPLKGEWGARHGGSQEETAQMCLLKPGRVGQVDSENYGASGHRHLGETDCTLREAPAMVSGDGGVDPGALRPSHRTARPDVVIKVARRMVLRELQLDADRAICMAVVKHIEGNVLRVRCVPYRRYARRTWCATGRRRDGKRAWCQERPARRRVHGWAWPTRR